MRGSGFVRAVGIAVVALLASCFDSTPKQEQFGGETHFMRGCGEGCAAPLECVCGVCSQPCGEAGACEALAAGAQCVAVDADAAACGQGEPERACASLCGANADCEALGRGFSCVKGQCRDQDSKQAEPVFEEAAAACAAGECGMPEQPFVMLLVDTSGSMEYKTSCKCTSPGCTECLPDCRLSERNRWVDVLEALSGRFEDYGCAQLPRSAELGATFDEGYFLPYHRPLGEQGDDGVLDQFRDRLRFGAATFDGWDTYKGAPPLVTALRDDPAGFDHERSAGWEGLWSYNLEREMGFFERLSPDGIMIGDFRYPGCENDYYIDTGIRGANAAEGALTFAADPWNSADVLGANVAIQQSLRVTRPYGGTPIASALDDLYYFTGRDPRMALERAIRGPKYVVLITDGRPDADYRDLNCQCGQGDPSDPYRCMPPGEKKRGPIPAKFQPDLMHCPYPTDQDAARALRCGRGDTCDGPVDGVYVVGYSVDDTDVTDRLDAIALAGGEQGARFADNGTELRAQLEALFEEIASQP